MLAHAIDNPAPSTIVLISGDRDFAYALSILRLRRYNVVLITLSNAHPSLKAQASLCFNWISDVSGTVDPTTVFHRPTSPRRGKPPPTHDKFYSDIKNYNISRFPFQEPNDEKLVNGVEPVNHVPDKTKYEDICLTPPKRDFRPDFSSELGSSKRQPAVSITSTNARSGPESPPRIIHSPVASSSDANLNDNTETPLIMIETSHDSNTLQTSSSGGNSPKLASHGGIMASGFHILRGSTSLPNLVLEHKTASVTTEPVSFESAIQTQIPFDEPDSRGQSCSPSPHKQSTFGLSADNQMYDLDDNPKSSPTHLNVFPSTNVVTSLPTLSFTLPSSLVNHPTTTTTTTPTAVVAAATPQISKKKVKKPTKPAPKPPPVPDKFKVLVECLKSYRSKGIIQPLRSQIATEIAQNGITYRRAGVTRFSEYTAIAEKEGIIVLGGWKGTAWIALLEPWV